MYTAFYYWFSFYFFSIYELSINNTCDPKHAHPWSTHSIEHIPNHISVHYPVIVRHVYLLDSKIYISVPKDNDTLPLSVPASQSLKILTITLVCGQG